MARSRGSVRKTDFGTFEVRWSYDGHDGKRKQGSKSLKTNREAQQFLTGKLKELDEGIHVEPTRLTLAVHLEEWMQLHVKRNCKVGTQASYETILRLHLIPRLGNVPLEKLDALRIERAFTEMAKTLSVSRRRVIYATLTHALKCAVLWKRLKVNPCEGVAYPSNSKLEEEETVVKALDVAEVDRLLSAARDTDLYPTAFLALRTGMRSGELLGLKWEDFDFEKQTIHVRRTTVRFEGQVILNSPKSGKSRIIEVDGETVALLRQLRVKQADERLQEFVFPDKAGRLQSSNDVSSKWKRLVETCGMPDLHFHDLRHTHATLLLKAGVSIFYVSKRLGHASVDFTNKVYAAYLPSMDREAAEALSSLLRPVANS